MPNGLIIVTINGSYEKGDTAVSSENSQIELSVKELADELDKNLEKEPADELSKNLYKIPVIVMYPEGNRVPRFISEMKEHIKPICLKNENLLSLENGYSEQPLKIKFLLRNFTKPEDCILVLIAYYCKRGKGETPNSVNLEKYGWCEIKSFKGKSFAWLEYEPNTAPS